MPDRKSTDDNNPFAPPPEGQPDQPWQPRRPEGSDDDSSSEPSGSSPGRWSSRQPGRSTDGWGRRPERPSGEGGPDQSKGPGMKWDPKDPAQRRARYALLAGMWAFFFAIFEIRELALLLGALALYWGGSALRTKPRTPTAGDPSAPSAASMVRGASGSDVTGATGATASGAAGSASEGPGWGSGASAAGGASGTASRPGPARAQRTAAISGLVAGVLSLLIVAGGFALQLVYRDFYTCADDALTKSGQLACNDLLPEPLRDVFGVRE
ncbi:hypothetical protein [Streptomyces sp. NPDC008121]|uniref:hypothetical protein n=1 Tax=Streptomyces sp. NPDC008121 TaxID=3364809 RepID=UPI0036EAF03C